MARGTSLHPPGDVFLMPLRCLNDVASYCFFLLQQAGDSTTAIHNTWWRWRHGRSVEVVGSVVAILIIKEEVELIAIIIMRFNRFSKTILTHAAAASVHKA